MLKQRGDAPVMATDGWAANLELTLALRAVARRIENVPLAARYDLRPRPSRVRPWHDAMQLFRAGKALRRLAPPAAAT